MATIPTDNPIASESPRDLKFNAGKVDEFVNSQEEAFSDRFGRARMTIAGIEKEASQAYMNVGFVPVDSFEDGATLTNRNQALHYLGDGNYYRWDGALPKVIQPSSTPASSGGVSAGAWVNVTDNTLRSAIAGSNGAGMVGYKSSAPGALQTNLASRNEAWKLVTADFGAKGDGVTDDTEAFIAASSCGFPVYIPATSAGYVVTGLVGSLTDNSSNKWHSDGAKIFLSGNGGFQVNGQGWVFKGIDFIPRGKVNFAIKTGSTGDNHRFLIESCNFYVATGLTSDYFVECIELNQCWYGNVNNCYLRNGGNINFEYSGLGTGIKLNACVNMSLYGNTFGGFNRAFHITDFSVNSHKSEGVFLKSCTFVTNNYSIVVDDALYINVIGCMIDIPGKNGYPIQMTGAQHLIADNWIFTDTYPVLIGNGTQYGDRHMIRNNQFGGPDTGGNTLLALQSTNLTSITGNKFFGGLQAVNTAGTCNNIEFKDNSIVNPSVRAYDLSLAVNSVVGNNQVSGATTTKSISDSVRVIPIQTAFQGTFSIGSAISAGSSANVTVNLPSGVFLTAPDYASLVTDTSVQIIARYVKGSSNGAALTFNIMAVNAAAASGTYTAFVNAGSITDAR